MKSYLETLLIGEDTSLKVPYDIRLQNENQVTQELSDHKGKLILLEFTAAYCGACRKINPKLKELHNRFKDKDFEIFTVFKDESNIKIFVNVLKGQITWPHVMLVDSMGTPDKQVITKYNTRVMPDFFLISSDFELIKRNADINSYRLHCIL